jgi:hypothetical protein
MTPRTLLRVAPKATTKKAPLEVLAVPNCLLTFPLLHTSNAASPKPLKTHVTLYNAVVSSAI